MTENLQDIIAAVTPRIDCVIDTVPDTLTDSRLRDLFVLAYCCGAWDAVFGPLPEILRDSWNITELRATFLMNGRLKDGL